MTRPGGLSPKGMLKIAAVVALAIAGVFVALWIIAAIQRGLSALSQTAQGVLLVSVGLVAWGGRRFLARDRERREREQARAAAAAVATIVTNRPASFLPPLRSSATASDGAHCSSSRNRPPRSPVAEDEFYEVDDPMTTPMTTSMTTSMTAWPRSPQCSRG